MKKYRIAGILVLVLALAVAALGFAVEGAKEGARTGGNGCSERQGCEESGFAE